MQIRAHAIIVDPSRGVLVCQSNNYPRQVDGPISWLAQNSGVTQYNWMLPTVEFDSDDGYDVREELAEKIVVQTGYYVDPRNLRMSQSFDVGETRVLVAYTTMPVLNDSNLIAMLTTGTMDNFGVVVCSDDYDGGYNVVTVDGRKVHAYQKFQDNYVYDVFNEALEDQASLGIEIFPPRAHLWYSTILRANPKLPPLGERHNGVEYALGLLAQIAMRFPNAPTLQATNFYQDCFETAIKWKKHGVYRGKTPEELRAYASRLTFLASKYGIDIKLHAPVTFYRVDHALDAAAGEGERIMLERNQASLEVVTGCFGAEEEAREYRAEPGISLFPIFFFDKLGEAFNECEVLAIGPLTITSNPDRPDAYIIKGLPGFFDQVVAAAERAFY